MQETDSLPSSPELLKKIMLALSISGVIAAPIVLLFLYPLLSLAETEWFSVTIVSIVFSIVFCFMEIFAIRFKLKPVFLFLSLRAESRDQLEDRHAAFSSASVSCSSAQTDGQGCCWTGNMYFST